MKSLRLLKNIAAAALTVGWTFPAFGIDSPRDRVPLPNFDRRLDAAPVVESMQAAGRKRAAQSLQARMSDLRIDRDTVTKSPKWIGSTGRFLTGPDGEGGAVDAAAAGSIARGDSHRAVKVFLNAHREIFGHDAAALAGAQVTRDDASPSGLRTVVWQQFVEGIPVFEGVLKAGLTRRGELVNIGSQFAAGAKMPEARVPRITVRQAVGIAAREIGVEVGDEAIGVKDAPAGAQLRQHFEAPGLTDPVAQLTLLPMDEATLRLCWSVILTNRERGELFRVLVDAETGAAHLRHCLTEYINEPHYRVFTSDSPTPMSPGLATPGTAQPPQVARTLVTTPPLNVTASPSGWIDDGVNETRGNNVDAHTDTNKDNVADLPRPQGSPDRVFDFPLDLTLGPETYRDAAVTNLFYWCNRVHDRFYELGFTEAAGNFQNDNFGRGGLGNDAIQADAQDGSGTNNANFSYQPDGSPCRIQMYVFTGPTPDRDGDFDAEILIHEYTHGLSCRLVGGGVGITAWQTRGMGEGWSDFYGLCLLSEAGDNVDGNYAAGAYASSLLKSGFEQNYYFGIRRYPYSTNLTKNPLTLKDIDPTQADPHSNVPFSPRYSSPVSSPDEVHNQGEVWCVTLWEARANLVKKLGFSIGNELILQIVTDGMKLAPPNPNFLQARDAILQAEQVLTAGAHRNELWAAFAKRGMGTGAIAPPSATTTGVNENFDLPDDFGVSPVSAFTASGGLGGPFTPGGQSYILGNYGTEPITWTATRTQPWVTLSATGGTLTPGETTSVAVTLNASAAALEFGNFADSVTFFNETSGIPLPRAVVIKVIPPRVLYLPLDSDPGWARTGPWTYGHPPGPTIFTPNPTSGATGPDFFRASGVGFQGGTNVKGPYYLTTAALDCRGIADVQLQFECWLNTTGPVDAIVEVSNDGNKWTEVWNDGDAAIAGSAWGKVQYDISAVADLQPTVFIRWSYRLGTKATIFWNIDDIEILGSMKYVMTAFAAPATEGDGPAAGTVTASLPPVDDLVVNLVASASSRLSVPPSVTIAAGTTTVSFPVAAIDDALLNGSASVSVQPSAFHWSSHAGTIQVQDNETATLAVSVPPNASLEMGSVAGTVTVSAPPASDVVVSLASGAPAFALPPANVTIPAGQTSVPFALAIVNNGQIDGPQNVAITASVANWTSGVAMITVDDTKLALSVPANVTEGGSYSGTVGITGTLPIDVTVILTSDDPSEITVPASVKIPAGQTSAGFSLIPINDSDTEALQTVHVSATATGFIQASAPVIVADNSSNIRFSFGPIVNPQVRGAPITVSIAAKDVNGAAVPFYFNSVINFTAVCDSGSLTVTPAGTSSFFNGVWIGKIWVNEFATNAVISASDILGTIGTSNVFDVGTGPVQYFTWNPIASPQIAGVPIAGTVRAIDAGGNAAVSFTGPANLAADLLTARTPTGTGTTAWNYPFSPGPYSAVRVQTIYPASALGGSGRLAALAVNVSQTSGRTAKNWTIRLKHTTQTSATPVWETSGWTVVHRSDAVISGTGWLTFPFQTRFDYDGTSNLMVDLSFFNDGGIPAPSADLCAASSYSPPRTVTGIAPGTASDPLTWANDGSIFRQTSFNTVNLRFTTASAVAIQPSATAAFVSGVWSGNMVIPAPGSSLVIRADDGAGHAGDSGVFTVNPADADSDGLPDAWEMMWWGVTTGHSALDDFDRDGLNELLELAFNLNPKASDSTALPPVVEEDGYLTITITKRSGVTYEVQSASAPDAAAFSTATTTVLVNDATTLKVRDNFLVGTPPARFLRVKVTAAP